MDQIFTFSGTPEPFNPTSKPEATFFIPQMTLLEQEQVGIQLYRHGMAPISDQEFRDRLILSIYEYLDDEGEADNMAAQAEEMWQGDTILEEEMMLWRAQEEQRRFDLAKGATGLEPAPPPVHTMSRKRRAETHLLLQTIGKKHPPMIALTTEKMNFNNIARRGTSRLMIQNWKGLKTEFVQEDGIIPEAVYVKMMDEIGRQAIGEVEQECVTRSVVTERERGNFDSLPDTKSDQTGSPALNDESGSKSGNSTESSTTQTPASGSDKTTGDASNSTSASAGETSKPDDTP